MSENNKNKIHNRNDEVKHVLNSQICERIEKLCSEIDPYSPLSSEVLNELEALGIEDTDNPFSITNQLLQLLDKYQLKQQNLQ